MSEPVATTPGPLAGLNGMVADRAREARDKAKLMDEKIAYLAKVLVQNIEVEKSFETQVHAELRNAGDRAIAEVRVTVFGKDQAGNTIFEKRGAADKFSKGARLVFYDSPETLRLKPNSVRPFSVRLEDPPSSWSGKVDVVVTSVDFAP
jgi:hypothetical protein